MKKESHGAARRDMIVGCDRLIENGKDGVYGSGKNFGRIRITEENIGPRMVEIESREAKLWDWDVWFGMWTTSRFPAGDLVGRDPDKSVKGVSAALTHPLQFSLVPPH